MASTVYGKTVTKADETERFVGKMLVLGAGYGIGSANFKHQLAVKKVKLTDQEAVNAIQSYRQKHPHIVRLWGTADWYLRNMIGGHSYDWGVLQIKGKKIALPNGCAMDYTGLYPEGKDVKLATARGDTKMYGGKFVENITQALARVVMADMMLQIAKRYKIMTTTHDEIVYLAPEREADEAMAFGLVVMKTSPAWAKDLPLNAEGGYDVRYSK
jgi:DNA polymerase